MAVAGSIGSMFIEFGVELSPLEKGLVKAGKSIKDFGRQMKTLGKDMSKSISLPIAAIGALAVKFAKDIPVVAQSFAQLSDSAHEAGLAFGKALAPSIVELTNILTRTVDIGRGVIEWLGQMPEGFKSTVVAIGALLAVAGPVLIFLGGLLKALGTLQVAFITLNASLGPAGWAMLLSAVAAAGVGLWLFGKRARETRDAMIDMDTTVLASTETVKRLHEQAKQFNTALEGADAELLKAWNAFKVTGDEAGYLEEKITSLKKKLRGLSDAASTDKEMWIKYADEIENTRDQIEQAEQSLANVKNTAATGGIMDALNEAKSRVPGIEFTQGPTAALKQQVDAYAAAVEGLTIKFGANSEQVAALMPRYTELISQWQQAQVLGQLFDGIASTVAGAFDTMGKAFAETIIWGKSFTKAMTEMFRNMVSELISLIMSFIMKLLALKVISTLFGIALPGSGPAVSAGLGKMLGLADGGIVTGPTLAMVGEAGPEAVIPLDRLGGMGSQTIYVELDGRRIAESTARNMPSVLRVQTGIMQ